MDFKGAEAVSMVRRLEEHTAALSQVASSLSVVMKCGPNAGEDPFAQVKKLITDLMNELQAEASPEANHKPDHDAELTRHFTKNEDLETQLMTQSSELELFRRPAFWTMKSQTSRRSAWTLASRTPHAQQPGSRKSRKCSTMTRWLMSPSRCGKSFPPFTLWRKQWKCHSHPLSKDLTQCRRSPGRLSGSFPVPHVQYVDVPVLKMQRQVPVIQTVQKSVNVPQSTFESNPAGSKGDVTLTSVAVTPGDEPSIFESTPQQHTLCDDACRCGCCRAV